MTTRFSTSQPGPRILVVGFDGLCPRSVNPSDMPCLWGFLHEWTRLDQYTAVFPVETYVNHPTIFSGCLPRRHGIIANSYYNPAANPDSPLFAGWSVASVEAQDTNGTLFGVPTLGDRLGQAGKTMTVICSNSAGSTRLQHHHADRYPGHLNLPVRDTSAVLPASARVFWQTIQGDGYPLVLPDYPGTSAVTRAFFDGVLPQGQPDVTVLWIGEPDHSSHHHGIDAQATTDARRQADACFGDILDWWKTDGGGTQLFVVSDHGHVGITGHVDIRALLEDAGLSVSNGRDEGRNSADAVLIGDYCGGLWFRNHDHELLARAAEALAASPQTGMLFSGTQGGKGEKHAMVEGRLPGTFHHALVLCDHPRAPDLRFVLRGNPATGETHHALSLPVGGSAHGGLLPQELASVCALGGSRCKRDFVSRLPAGPADISPTILYLLGLNDALPELDGRVLTECLTETEDHAPTSPRAEIYETGIGDLRQYLIRVRYQGRVYLTEGGRRPPHYLPSSWVK